MERAAPVAGNDFGFGQARGGAREVGRDGDVGENFFVKRFDALEIGLGDFDRRNLPGAEFRGERGDVEAEEFGVISHWIEPRGGQELRRIRSASARNAG